MKQKVSPCRRRLRKPCCCGHRTRHPLLRRSSLKQQARGTNNIAVFIPGRPYQRNRRRYARYQTTGPTRVGMLRSVQAGAVRYGDSFTHAEGAHANVRGDGDTVAWVCDVDSAWSTPLCSTARTTSSFGSLASIANNAPTTACRISRPSRRHNVRALRRLSANGVSCLRLPYSGHND